MFNQKDSFFLFWLCPHQRVGLPWAGSSHYPKVAATGPGITYLHDNLQQQRTMTPHAAYVSEETFIRGLQHLSMARRGSHAFSKLVTGKGMV